MVTEVKSAYDNYSQSLIHDSDEGSGSESELEQTDDASDTLGEPPKKKTNEEFSELAGMAKVVNKPQQDGEYLAPVLSELVKQLLSNASVNSSSAHPPPPFRANPRALAFL